MEPLSRYGNGTQIQLHLDTETQELELIAQTIRLDEFEQLLEALTSTCKTEVLDVVRRRNLTGVGRYTISVKLSGYPCDTGA